jgi:hypothetical protein
VALCLHGASGGASLTPVDCQDLGAKSGFGPGTVTRPGRPVHVPYAADRSWPPSGGGRELARLIQSLREVCTYGVCHIMFGPALQSSRAAGRTGRPAFRDGQAASFSALSSLGPHGGWPATCTVQKAVRTKHVQHRRKPGGGREAASGDGPAGPALCGVLWHRAGPE